MLIGTNEVIYGSARRQTIGSKTFKKNLKKLKPRPMTYLGPAVSFKTMNQPDPTVTLFGGLYFGKYKR